MSKPDKKPLPPDWIIHFIANGVQCEECGEVEDGFPDFICNAHTHGMERYGHLDFQVVLQLEAGTIGWILNTLGDRVRNGEKFKDGDLVTGFLKDDWAVRLSEFPENDRSVLRVIIPDDQNRFPEDRHCKYPYSFQIFTVEMLEEIKRQAGEQLS